MFGFLFAGALIGGLAIGWPFYLHIKRRRQVVQAVPSLRLFQRTRRTQRRTRLQELLLMLARVVAMAALFLVIAQPVIRSFIPLPLPLAAGEPEEQLIFGILIDDSLSAVHGDAEGNRLELSKAWLRRELAGLPATAQIRLVTTVSPFPSPPLSRDAALTAIDQISLIPKAGDAVEALEALLGEVEGRQGAVLVAAPRSLGLWRQLEAVPERSAAVHLWWLDTSERRGDSYIRGISPGGEADQVTVELGGDPARLAGTNLRLLVNGEPVQDRLVQAADVPAQAVTLDLTPAAGAVYEVIIEAEYEHPWLRYGFTTGRLAPGRQQVVILRPETREGLTVDKVATALLTAALPSIRIRHLDAGTAPPAELGEADVVLIAGGQLDGAWQPWLRQQVEQGVRLLQVPLAEERSVDSGANPWRVAWEDARLVTTEELTPLTWQDPVVSGVNLRGLLLLGLRELSLNEVKVPVDMAEGAVVLRGAGGEPLLVADQIGDQSDRWVFGFTWNLGDGSPVFQPLFPLLVEQIVQGDQAGESRFGAARVGESMLLPEWFGQSRLEGDLVTPDGDTLPVLCSATDPQVVPIQQSGTYTMRQGEQRWARYANHRREPQPELFDRLTWDEQMPTYPVTWLFHTENFPFEFARRIGGLGFRPETRQYDLTPLAVALLMLALLVESGMLLQAWRREP